MENIIMSPTETDIQTVRIQAESSPKIPEHVLHLIYSTHTILMYRVVE